MMTDLRSGERYRVILGNTFTADLPDGAQLRVDHRDSSALISSETIDADADGADFEPLATGLYWLAWRPDEDAEWCRAGVIECATLVDEDEENLIAELETVHEQIRDSTLSLIQYQVTDPSGTAVTRMTLKSLHAYRATLELRLAEYRRTRRGALPMRLN